MAKYKLMTSQVVTTRENIVYEVEAESEQDAKRIFMDSIELSSENQFEHYKDEDSVHYMWDGALPSYADRKDVFLKKSDAEFDYIDTFAVLPNNDETLNK